VRNLDFSSWQGLVSTLMGLAVITLIGVGIRLLLMQTVQQRRERENRQINERLRTLIAAYKVLGGSFTGDLAVDPAHLRDQKRKTLQEDAKGAGVIDPLLEQAAAVSASDRSRRIRDAVEASLSDVILLGTEQQVRLASRAAAELAAGRPAHTAELVVSLRDFVRQVLDLDAVPGDVEIPRQGPARPSSSRGGREGGGNDKEAFRSGGKGAGGDGSGGGGMSAGVSIGTDEESEHHH
jgi:hypothetical protein